MAAFLRAVRTTFQRHPAIVASLQTGTLMVAGDAICQTWLEGHRTLDTYQWDRTVRFGLIGTFFVGPTLRVWYGFLQRKYGEKGFQVVAQKLAVDQIGFAPCFTFVFLTVNYLLEGQTGMECQDSVRRDYQDVVVAGWMVWPWVQLCNFAVVPLAYQVLFVQTFALFWNTYLSWKINVGSSVFDVSKLFQTETPSLPEVTESESKETES